jgi:GT2 family glycosyltransferase
MHEQTSPEVSLVIATCNRHDFLQKFLTNLARLESITLPRYEVIVVENHADKIVAAKTQAISDAFNVAFYHAPGLGHPHACNRGILEAKGEYIALTDDDCIITDPEWLAKMVAIFKKYPKVGYVSGRVTSLKNANEYQNLWEAKGGLGKGAKDLYWSEAFLSQAKFKILPWQFHKICAGANYMIPAKVFKEVGLLNTALGQQGLLKHGYSLEIGYRIARAGYELYYTTDVEIFHFHPDTAEDIKSKLYLYGKGDSGYPMSIFLNYFDYRYLWWALIGHASYTIRKMILSLRGRYPLPLSYIVHGLRGNSIGWAIAIYDHIQVRSLLKRNQYDGFTTLKQEKKRKADRL